MGIDRPTSDLEVVAFFEVEEVPHTRVAGGGLLRPTDDIEVVTFEVEGVLSIRDAGGGFLD